MNVLRVAVTSHTEAVEVPKICGNSSETYRTEPPVPTAPLPTLGTRLLLLANDGVPTDTIELIVKTIYGSRYAGLSNPPLDSADLERPTHIPLHAGTLAYVARDKPFISDDRV